MELDLRTEASEQFGFQNQRSVWQEIFGRKQNEEDKKCIHQESIPSRNQFRRFEIVDVDPEPIHGAAKAFEKWGPFRSLLDSLIEDRIGLQNQFQRYLVVGLNEIDCASQLKSFQETLWLLISGSPGLAEELQDGLQRVRWGHFGVSL